MNGSIKLSILSMVCLCFVACSGQSGDLQDGVSSEGSTNCNERAVEYSFQEGCDGQVYPNPENSPYIVPFALGTSFRTGLTNCAESFHRAGSPDQYAFDFDLPVGTPFIASRGGVVLFVEESQSSSGGGIGNSIVVDHGDSTFGVYLHSPMYGIYLEKGDEVQQGQELGEVGLSGLAGYPHLHFIVVKDDPTFPYEGIPISFNNVAPADVILQGNKNYQVCEK